MTVLDASVLVKLILDEPQSGAALELLEAGTPLCAPDLARLEVSNAILRIYRTSVLTEAVVRERLAQWAEITNHDLELVPNDAIYAAAIDLAIALRHPLADCLYLALAMRNKDQFVTADRPFFTKARAIYEGTVLLGNAT
jgi:predicted nucleic acid-binding protein